LVHCVGVRTEEDDCLGGVMYPIIFCFTARDSCSPQAPG
jgi:hypothetical protein